MYIQRKFSQIEQQLKVKIENSLEKFKCAPKKWSSYSIFHLSLKRVIVSTNIFGENKNIKSPNLFIHPCRIRKIKLPVKLYFCWQSRAINASLKSCVFSTDFVRIYAQKSFKFKFACLSGFLFVSIHKTTKRLNLTGPIFCVHLRDPAEFLLLVKSWKVLSGKMSTVIVTENPPFLTQENPRKFVFEI